MRNCSAIQCSALGEGYRLASPGVGGYGDELALVTVTRGPVVVRPAPAPRVLQVDTAGVPAIPGAEVLRLTEDLGRPAAVNRGIAQLEPSVGWVLVADAGLQWPPGALDALRATAAATPRAALLGPLLRSPAGAALPSCGPLPVLRDLLRDTLPSGPVRAGDTGWLDGTCLLLRRLAWDSVDGYDPRYPGAQAGPDPADVDLGARLVRAGWRVLGVPAAEVVVHAAGGQGILVPGGPEPRGPGLRRYVRDRYRAPVRVLAALARRG